MWTSAWLISVQFHTFNLAVPQFLCWNDKCSHHMATMLVCKRNLFTKSVIELHRILTVVYHIHNCFAFALCWLPSVPKSIVSNTVFWILEMFLCTYKNTGRHIMSWAISYHIVSYHIISYRIVAYPTISYHIIYHIISYIISYIYHVYHIIYYIIYHLFSFCRSVQDYKIHMDM